MDLQTDSGWDRLDLLQTDSWDQEGPGDHPLPSEDPQEGIHLAPLVAHPEALLECHQGRPDTSTTRMQRLPHHTRSIAITTHPFRDNRGSFLSESRNHVMRPISQLIPRHSIIIITSTPLTPCHIKAISDQSCDMTPRYKFGSEIELTCANEITALFFRSSFLPSHHVTGLV